MQQNTLIKPLKVQSYPVIQDYLSGSNEMLFIPGEPTELQLYHAPGPKIAYSYQHDPKVTPMRKISTNSSVVALTITPT